MLKGIMVQWFNVLNCETINALTTPEVNLSARILYSSVGEGRFLVFYYCHILLLHKRFFFWGGGIALGSRGRLIKEHGIIF